MMLAQQPVTGQNSSMLDDSLREATEIAGDRWVLRTVAVLEGGPGRFGDLLSALDGIAPNVLIDRLRRMERAGIVLATPYSQRPRRYVYDLTDSGRELAAVMPALATWASRRSGGEVRRHSVCGTALETRVWCPGCRAVVDRDDSDGAEKDDLRWV
jgi:DNA-binding HxlR family transcriptional regulator